MTQKKTMYLTHGRTGPSWKPENRLPIVEVYRDGNFATSWRWRRLSSNRSNNTSNGGQGFSRPSDAVRSAHEQLEGPYRLHVLDRFGEIRKISVEKATEVREPEPLKRLPAPKKSTGLRGKRLRRKSDKVETPA